MAGSKLPMSLWLMNAGLPATQSATTFSKFPKHVAGRPPHFDVVVVGGGIVGLQTAWNLKTEGKKVAVLEARNVGAGTTGFSTGKLCSLQGLKYSQLVEKHGAPAAKLYYEMNEKAINKVERLTRELGLGCEFERRSHTFWTSDPKKSSIIRKEYEACSDLGISCDFVDAAEIHKELPTSIEALSGVRFRDQAQFNSYKYCLALAKLVDGDGCVVYENSRVGLVTEGDPHVVTVQAEGGSLTGDFIVLATHLPIMDRSMHFAFLEPSRSHCLAIKVKNSPLKNMFISSDMPMRSLRTSHQDSVVVIAGESVVMGGDGETEKFYDHLMSWASSHFHIERVVARWSAMDYISPDLVPFSGYLYEGTRSIFTATGFNKWGLSNGIASADLIADLIAGRENLYSAMVDARRWSFKGLVAENLHAAKHFVADKVKHVFVAEHIKDLRPGQGGIVKKGIHKVGVYIDKEGKARCVKPVCTHLGCDLVFNQGDKIWDCPCHGSQFDAEGNVLHGPACKPLKKVEW